ncbi:MAG: BA14K family protein [Bradyrhizobium sp.]|nr:MAG: BA14K family protein [Bradyrhizobium sp.]
MRHSLFAGVAAASLFALTFSAAPASAQGGQAYRPNESRQVQNAYPHRDFGRGSGRDYGRNNFGGDVAAGVAGLAAGAIIGGAIDQDYGYGYGYGPDYDYQAGAYPSGSYVQTYPVDPDAGVVYGPQVAEGDDTVAYCQRTFHSYDPASGTYLGYDGMRHSCP